MLSQDRIYGGGGIVDVADTAMYGLLKIGLVILGVPLAIILLKGLFTNRKR